MHPLPRYLALALFVVLAALLALLAIPAWQGAQASGTGDAESRAAAAASAGTSPPAARLARLSQRAALVLALVAAILALVLAVALAVRVGKSADSQAPYATLRAEVGTLAMLVESSAAQGEELDRERDVRKRAEDDVRLRQQLLARSVDEKIRLGQDLHDGIIQSLYAAGLTLESIRPLLRSDPEEADRRLEQARQNLNGTIRDVRTYITGLTSENLRRAGFSHGVNTLLAEIGGGRATRFQVDIDEAAAAQLDPEQSVEALQIAREAVSNALRHGGASEVTLRVQVRDKQLYLLIQDNGAGFQVAARGGAGHGLANIRARVERLGATLQLNSAPGQGCRLEVRWPKATSLHG